MSNNKAFLNEQKIVKILKINEYLWLFFVCVSIILTAYSIIVGQREQAIYFIVMTFLAGIFYSFKRRQRKRQQERLNNPDSKK
jgi:nicotinamide riboside transporter PnuC